MKSPENDEAVALPQATASGDTTSWSEDRSTSRHPRTRRGASAQLNPFEVRVVPPVGAEILFGRYSTQREAEEIHERLRSWTWNARIVRVPASAS